MMATEATLEKPADAPASTDSQPISDFETTSQNVVQKPSLNGGRSSDDIENKRITAVEDQGPSTDVSVSGGSDTEASKADSSKPLNDDKGHERTSSTIKKPTTFKAVSVNKTFLASKAGGSAAATKSGDKSLAASSMSSSPLNSSGFLSNRPRLIAKTGSGSRDSIPRFAANGKPAAAPDPTSVWNKNRPTPPPEPRKLSDEELKKYGIHMATRLHSEDNKGQSNWADIDDDDDDWAPETITWTDGTKITLPAPDETSSVGPTQAAGTAIAKDKPASDKTRSAAPSRTASPSVKSGGLASGKGLILKAGSTEKVTLVAKPSAPPPPAKSPWAPLPPIQKASPVAVDSPPLHTSPRPSLREPHIHRPFQHSATREIAADDFSRSSWREAPNMPSRELYNSQSGRYEPVQDRRGSFRADVYSRPALLQRPHPHHHDSTEPSPTFQASRPVQDGPFGRRRGSSNVSGGSGLLQRVGKGYDAGPMPPPDILNTRRGSFAASTDSHISPRNFSPSGQAGARLQSSHAWPPRTSPSAAYATPHYSQAPSEKPPTHQGGPGSNVALQSEEDTVEFQKRLMRERREEAIRRRLEEEAREEAAKAERIRLKLEAMGPPPERKSAKKETTNKGNTDAAAPTTPSLEHSTVSVPGQATTAANDHNVASQEDHSTSKPANVSATTTLPAGLQSELSADSQSQSKQTRQQDMSQPHLWHAPAPSSSSRLTSWPSSGQQQSRNVWGSPNNDRGLGNGTFDPNLGRVPESRATQLPQAPAKEPAPIGPPSTRALSQQPPPQAYPTTRLDRYGAPEPRQYNEKQNQWVSSVLQSDASLREQRARERADFDQRLAEQGLTHDDAQPTVKQTWRPDPSSTRPDQVSRVVATSWGRALDEGSKHSNSISPDTHAPNGVISGSGAASILTSSASAAPSAQPRASRFFPPKERDIRAGTHTNSESERPKSPSPPPPTMDDHPAYDGDASHPHVSLPPPQPIVKLPPAPPMATSSQAPKVDSTWLNPAHHRPLHSSSTTSATVGHHSSITIHSPPQSQQEWQEKIYELTGRRGAPRSPAVESASRTMLDHSSQHNPATVSLPSHIAVKETDKGGVTSKPMAEECFEEQEMGSLPLIRIPHKAPDAAWQPAVPTNKPLPRTFMVVANTAKHLDLSDHSAPNYIRISFPGMPMEAKTVPFHSSNRGSSRGTGHGRSGGRNRASGSNYRGVGSGKRDTSSTFTSESTSSAQGPTSSLGSRGRGSYRTRSGETWSRRSTHSTNN